MPEISVIVPMHNAQKFIINCVNSVLNQSFTDFELLLVNDGSTDETLKICTQLSQKDSRIKIINKENGGVQTAIIKGIENAKSDYCAFIDADDEFRNEFLKKLFNSARKSNADIAFCGYENINSNNEITDGFTCNENKLYSVDDIKNSLNDFFAIKTDLNNFCSAARWNKLYKTALLKEILPEINPAQTMGEDMAMNLHALMHCKCIAMVNYSGYAYKDEQGSATRSMNIKKFNQYEFMFETLHKIAHKYNFENTAALKKRKNELYCVLLLQILMSEISYNEKKQVISLVFNEIDDKNYIVRFANTQPIHGKIALKIISKGIFTLPLFATNLFLRIR